MQFDLPWHASVSSIGDVQSITADEVLQHSVKLIFLQNFK